MLIPSSISHALSPFKRDRIFLGDLIPPGVENDDSEDEDSSTFLPEHESLNLDHQDNPSAPRPPPEPPDVKIRLKPDTDMINNFDVLNKEACFNLEEGTDIKEMDINKDKAGQNRAREWEEHGKSSSTKEEEKRIAEEQAALKIEYWKCHLLRDDDDYTLQSHPTVVVCAFPVDNTYPFFLKHFKEHSETIVDSNNDSTSSDVPIYPSVRNVSIMLMLTPDAGCDRQLKGWWDCLYRMLEGLRLVVARSTTSFSNLFSSGYYGVFSNSRSTLILKEKCLVAVSHSTTTHADFSQYDSFIFDLLINPFPPADRSDFYHEEFADGLAHIISPPDLECFYFKIEPDPGDLIDPGIRENVSSTTNVDLPFEDDQSPLLAYVVWIFLSFLTYPVPPPYLLSCGNEDTIFDPGISIYHSFMPGVSHQKTMRQIYEIEATERRDTREEMRDCSDEKRGQERRRAGRERIRGHETVQRENERQKERERDEGTS
ncbi:hypothetical protein Tco_1165232 [Tanacetum coccineum]